MMPEEPKDYRTLEGYQAKNAEFRARGEEIKDKALKPINTLWAALFCAAETAGHPSIESYLLASAASDDLQRQMCARIVIELRELGHIIKPGKHYI